MLPPAGEAPAEAACSRRCASTPARWFGGLEADTGAAAGDSDAPAATSLQPPHKRNLQRLEGVICNVPDELMTIFTQHNSSYTAVGCTSKCMLGTGQDMCAHLNWFRLCQQVTPHSFRTHAIKQTSALLYWKTCFWMILSAHICINMSIGSARLGALRSGARSCLAGALARGAPAVADQRTLGFGPARQAATGLTLPCTRMWNTSISFSLEIPFYKILTASSAYALPITVCAVAFQR